MEGNRHPGIAETTDRQFFALLRSGLWNEVPERAPFECDVDWEALWRLAFEQTVGPLVTDGINRLPKEFLPAEPERLDPFLGDMMATAQRNRTLDSFIPKLFHALRDIPVVLVKGQSLAQDYPDPDMGRRRTSFFPRRRMFRRRTRRPCIKACTSIASRSNSTEASVR